MFHFYSFIFFFVHAAAREFPANIPTGKHAVTVRTVRQADGGVESHHRICHRLQLRAGQLRGGSSLLVAQARLQVVGNRWRSGWQLLMAVDGAGRYAGDLGNADQDLVGSRWALDRMAVERSNTTLQRRWKQLLGSTVRWYHG
jgi:hypothetical protein